MAIKRSGDKSETSVPAILQGFCLPAFLTSAMGKIAEVVCKGWKGKIEEYVKSNNDGFEMDLSKEKSFKTPFGRVTWSEKRRVSYNVDAVIDCIKKGAVTLETVLNSVNFTDKAMQTALGSNYAKCVTEEKYDSLALYTSEEIQAEVAELIERYLAKRMAAANVAAPVETAAPAPSPVAPPVATVSETKKRKPAKKAAAAGQAPSVDKDIEGILS